MKIEFESIELGKKVSIILFAKNIYLEILSNKFSLVNNLREINSSMRESVISGISGSGENIIHNKLMNKSLRVAAIEEINFEILDRIIMVGDINVQFLPRKTEYELSCCYFLISSNSDELEKTLQIGLDNPYLARKLAHKAISCTFSKNNKQQWVINVFINHTKANMDREMLTNV